MTKTPRWIEAIVVPLVALVLAALCSGALILAIGESPVAAVKLMINGALGSTYAWGYTLYYATNFIFTGLAVSVAFHARIFNIGCEGQATLGGLGVALACLYLPWPHWTFALLGASLTGAIFGAAWAFLPAYMQAKRGSHIVITTIMFNFISYSLLNYLLVGPIKAKGMEPATEKFAATTNLPNLSEFLGAIGIPFSKTQPANITFLVALLACVFVWALIWRTRFGYELRAFGQSQPAAVYAGVRPVKIIIITMLISGALAGLMSINTVQGEAERLVLNSVEGAGFIGIAVALMGRNHPIGVFFAALLFGFLYQGGAELALWTSVPRGMVVVIQALVILFTGAFDNMVRMIVEKTYLFITRNRAVA